MPAPAKLVPITIVKVKDWSFSRLGDYDKCPRLYMMKKSKQIVETGNAAMERGNVIHKLAETYVGGSLKKFPQELLKFKGTLALMKKEAAVVEQSWAFRRDWSKTVWNDWNGCWLRVKMDVHYMIQEKDKSLTLYIFDYKTGRDHSLDPSGDDQLDLYTVTGAIMYPEVTKVITRLLYVDHGTLRENTTIIDAKWIEAGKKRWEKKTKRLFADTQFLPKPGDHCRWCPDRKTNGGGCIYS